MGKLDQLRAMREANYEAGRRRSAHLNETDVNNEDAVINTAPPSNAERQAKWRKANEALNRLRAREGMSKHRSKKLSKTEIDMSSSSDTPNNKAGSDRKADAGTRPRVTYKDGIGVGPADKSSKGKSK